MPTFPRQVIDRGTQTCHVCGEMRPDDKISIEKHKTVMPGTNMKVEENVRYCNDKAECIAAAPKVSFINRSGTAMEERGPTPHGEAPA